MSKIAALEKQFAAAEKDGNTASANRLRFIVSKEKRNAANRDDKAETRKRKAEDKGTGPYKAMRFTENGVMPASMGTIRDMILEERTREQAEIKAKADAAREREQERTKAEQARKTAQSNRKKAEYKARREAETKREREEKARQYFEREKRKEEERERRERNSNPKPKPEPTAQPPQPRAVPRPAARPATVQEIQAWRTFANACFADYSKVLTFPAPPGGCCTARGCQAAASAGRFLKACDCNIRRAFRDATGIDNRTERLKWHPDRWGKCPGAKREQLKKMAAEVFVVVNTMV